MEPEQTNVQANMTESQPPKQPGGGVAPVIAIIIIVLILALGGWYYFTQGIQQVTENDTALQDQQTVEELMAQGSSDTAAAIEADIYGTDLSEVDESVQASVEGEVVAE